MSIYQSEVILLQGKNQLNEELNRIKKNKVNFFPQGIEKIVETINCQIEANKEVFFVKEKKIFSIYFLNKSSISATVKKDQKITMAIMITWKKNEMNPKLKFVQGKDYVIKFIEESKRRNATFILLI